MTLLLSVRYKKYRLTLISPASAQLCCLWGPVCVCESTVFSHGTVIHFYILSICFHNSLISVVCVSRSCCFFSLSPSVCVRVFVCPDEEISGFSPLHRCRYGGISDIESMASSYKRPIKSDTLKILWTFPCSSSDLFHMVLLSIFLSFLFLDR